MFDIDYLTLSIAAVCIAAFAAPFYWNHRKSAQKLKQAMFHIHEVSKNLKLNLQEKDSWNNQYFIGLDPEQKVLLYAAEIHQTPPLTLDLTTVQRIKLEEKFHEFGQGRDKRKVIDRLDLVLIIAGQSSLQLEFYDAEKFSAMDGEPLLIKKWEKLLQSLLQQVPRQHVTT